MPGMKRGLKAGKKYSVEPLQKMVGALAHPKYHYHSGVPLQQVVFIALLGFVIGVLLMVYQPELHAVLRYGMKGSRLEPVALNLSHIPAVEDLAALWTTK